MTNDERKELLKDTESLAYVHIRFSGLWRELTNEEREQIAREYAEKIIELLESLVNERFTQIESHRQAKENTGCGCSYTYCDCGALLR